jgi:hypothetical protein
MSEGNGKDKEKDEEDRPVERDQEEPAKNGGTKK